MGLALLYLEGGKDLLRDERKTVNQPGREKT